MMETDTRLDAGAVLTRLAPTRWHRPCEPGTTSGQSAPGGRTDGHTLGATLPRHRLGKTGRAACLGREIEGIVPTAGQPGRGGSASRKDA